MISSGIASPTAETTTLEILALDLCSIQNAQHLWRRGQSRLATTSAVLDQLPPGRASVMGYWLTRESEAPQVVEANISPLSIRIVPTTESLSIPSSIAPTGRMGAGRATLSAKLKGSSNADGELTLTVWETGALVVASPATWLALSEPVLLAICQCWRFHAFDATLDRMTTEARGDLDHASMVVFSSFRQRSGLLANSKQIRELFLDLSHFAGPLTDPYAFLAVDKHVETYRSLVGKLHLEEWSESIDERAEGIDDTYASVTEKLNEFRNFLGGSSLEIVIIVILVIEVIFNVMIYLEV